MATIIPFGTKIMSNHLPGKEKATIYKYGETFARHFYFVKIGKKIKKYKYGVTLKQVIGYLKRMGY